MYWNRQRIGIALLQWRDLDHTSSGHGLHRNLYRRSSVNLLRRGLDHGRRNRSCRRSVYRNRQRIGDLVLQRCDLDHAGSRHGLYGKLDGGRFHLYGWILDDGG